MKKELKGWERKREAVGMRPPRTSYRLGKEHEISITRLPFHQTRTLGLPHARRILPRSRHVIFNDERRTTNETGRFRSSLSSFLFLPPPLFLYSFFFVGFWRRVQERIFEKLVNSFFIFLCHAQFPDRGCFKCANLFCDFLGDLSFLNNEFYYSIIKNSRNVRASQYN